MLEGGVGRALVKKLKFRSAPYDAPLRRVIGADAAGAGANAGGRGRGGGCGRGQRGAGPWDCVIGVLGLRKVVQPVRAARSAVAMVDWAPMPACAAAP